MAEGRSDHLVIRLGDAEFCEGFFRVGVALPHARALGEDLDHVGVALVATRERLEQATRRADVGADEHERDGTRRRVAWADVARKFVVQTFGCQMNEHDSERIASDLVAAGLDRTDDVADADVVVLNTCCIREAAETKLYGHLGHLKSIADRRPGMQIAVAGCLAQRVGADILARAPHVDAIFGTHNVGRATHLLDEATANRFARCRDPRRAFRRWRGVPVRAGDPSRALARGLGDDPGRM